MKKLLALILVLGMAATANATVMLSVNGDTAIDEIEICVGDTIWIDVYSDDAIPYGVWLDVTELDGTYGSDCGQWTGNYVLYSEAGPDAFVTYYDPGIEWYAEAKTFNPDDPVIPGKHFEFEFECLLEGCDVQIWMWDYGYANVIDIVTIHQVPEPASMLLLGLGGLLLRRRK